MIFPTPPPTEEAQTEAPTPEGCFADAQDPPQKGDLICGDKSEATK